MSFARRLQRNKSKLGEPSKRDWFMRTVAFRLPEDRYILATQHHDFTVSLFESEKNFLSKESKFLDCIKCTSPLSYGELARLVRTYVFHKDKLESRIIEDPDKNL